MSESETWELLSVPKKLTDGPVEIVWDTPSVDAVPSFENLIDDSPLALEGFSFNVTEIELCPDLPSIKRMGSDE